MARMTFARALRSEAVRMRRSPLVPMHLALAIALGGCAGLYFSNAAWDSLLGADAFFQLLGAGAPLVVGISCGLAVDVERDAGDGANLLGVPSRRVALAAKGTVLLALGFAAALVATLLFFALLAAAGRDVPPLAACIAAAAGIAAGSALLYAVSLWIAMRFGRNASIGVGALGLVVALASMGGLANGLVTGSLSGAFGLEAAMFVPFAWPSRLASLAVEAAVAVPLGFGPQAVEALAAALARIGAACAVGTTALVAVLLARANRFEDKRRGGE
ncbi:lantibiotic ABC transporter permease [Gordonibacter sp. 28C]|uniref:ABC transporter permease n=1 Tax=Gordonibacter sp. 28C TaxID=2078569 RepID=UPI000DF7EDDC|nr:ABC transporter permease [Gordonibacter sp. 28C]RDB63991.1 lantibiotic ABC transporter permease [Gordonibacter sp. 28C]